MKEKGKGSREEQRLREWEMGDGRRGRGSVRGELIRKNQFFTIHFLPIIPTRASSISEMMEPSNISKNDFPVHNL